MWQNPGEISSCSYVNFIKILRAAFALIDLRQKITKLYISREKLHKRL